MKLMEPKFSRRQPLRETTCQDNSPLIFCRPFQLSRLYQVVHSKFLICLNWSESQDWHKLSTSSTSIRNRKVSSELARSFLFFWLFCIALPACGISPLRMRIFGFQLWIGCMLVNIQLSIESTLRTTPTNTWCLSTTQFSLLEEMKLVQDQTLSLSFVQEFLSFWLCTMPLSSEIWLCSLRKVERSKLNSKSKLM